MMFKQSNKIKKKVYAILALFFISLSLFFNRKIEETKADNNLATWVLCGTKDGQGLYNLAVTDYKWFLLKSKSAVASLTDVNGGLLNGLLSLTGFDFKETNEKILGRPLVPDSIEDEVSTANGGRKVNVFDRFGMAGTTWSNYLGEWKYYQVDACSPETKVSPTNYNKFYTNRQEPLSTWNEVSTSKDPRSIQFEQWLLPSWMGTVNNTLANIIFGLSKFIVTITIVFIGLAFSNVPELIGLNNGVTSSVFNSLWNSIYMPFLILTISISGLSFLYIGLFKRQVREAFNGLIKLLGVFFLALLMNSNPSFYINLPNNIATVGQGLIIEALSRDATRTDDLLCSTDVGRSEQGDDLSGVAKNIQSTMSCKLWEKLIYTPWVRGQFGVEPHQLKAEQINNINKDWVGVPSVPLGGNQTIEDWGVFHLSTQTNAHSQLGESNVNTVVNGVNADWWRIVDAISNYNEKSVEVNVNGAIIHKKEQDNAPVIPMWNTWVGNKSSERLGIAIYSIPFSGISVLPILVFSALSSFYSIMLVLSMLIAPLMLLFGLSIGRGQGIFISWVQSVLNLFMKKIGTTFLLMLSFSLIMAGLDLMNSLGWIQSLVLILIMATILIQNREQILSKFANINIGGTWNVFNAIKESSERQRNRFRATRNLALGSIGGAIAGHRTGMGVFKGAKIAALKTVRNEAYKTSFGRNAVITHDVMNKTHQEALSSRTCMICGVQIHEGNIAFLDQSGNSYCRRCGEETGRTDLTEVVISKKALSIKGPKLRSERSTRNVSYLSYSRARELSGMAMDSQGRVYWNKNAVTEMVRRNMVGIENDVQVHKVTKLLLADTAITPKIPEPLEEYLDSAMINVAWETDNYDYIKTSYREAWKLYFEENHSMTKNYKEKDIEVFNEFVDNYEVKINDESIDEMITRVIIDYQTKTKPDKQGVSQYYDNHDIFIYDDENIVLDWDNDDDYNKDESKEKEQ